MDDLIKKLNAMLDAKKKSLDELKELVEKFDAFFDERKADVAESSTTTEYLKDMMISLSDDQKSELQTDLEASIVQMKNMLDSLSEKRHDLQATHKQYWDSAIEISPMIAGDFPDHIRVLYHNIGKGFNVNFVDLKKKIIGMRADVCFIAETGLTEKYEESLMRIGDIEYRVFNQPMTVAKGKRVKGGLMVLVNTKLLTNGITKGVLSGRHVPKKFGKGPQQLTRSFSVPNLGPSNEKLMYYHEDFFIDLCGVRYIFLYRNNSQAPVLHLYFDLLQLKKAAINHFVILGDFNGLTDEVQSSSRPVEEPWEFSLRTDIFKMMNHVFPNHIQLVKGPTSFKSMNPIDFVFDDVTDRIVEQVFVFPFLRSDRKHDHAPIFFLAKKKN